MPRKVPSASSDIHGHVLFMYESKKDRAQTLADYFKEGLANKELCIFVTPDSPATVTKEFKAAGLGIGKAVKDGSLRIFEMNKTYLPHGKFVADYMLMNVANFIIDAKAKGFNGIRTAGEMSWIDSHPEFRADSKKYEFMVNELNSTSPEFTGLCLYPVRKGLSETLDAALMTHPNFIYDGTFKTNPFSRVGMGY